ncbi:hypothetical protein Pmar_PMAR012970 [Perkinsus marinus ATCC 50983]|uniref:NAD(P)-binding domain-containing protein n=1 Tax=Perkinsus marinus (strain ATCC 50983 / TXsc) TaxID=423536 RepID=C5LN78_PERM5|nr:hypothetical protein Pmar_PMAR012970 [Perkinsus marinus ATCC 50983]EER01812.1 hypothetical protein Pmar_PMAR012970 [Perkinsus marinus ATCC 50983]|eukprot:XP_002769094.1 hypothetical protein Pmar_PMAR012970 [Perkinsus marinus ATCC 50983]
MGNAGAKSKLKTVDIAEDLSDLPAALKEYGTGAELAVSALGARGGRYGLASPADLFRLDVATNLSFAETAAQQLGVSHVALMSHVNANYNKAASDEAMPGNFKEAKGLLEYRIETSEVLKSLGTRVSLFKPALITGEPSDQCGPASSENLFLLLLVFGEGTTDTNFMRTQFREISADHLALAVRINHEMCVPSEGVSMEPLGYEECMRLIGKDDDI